MKSSDVFINEWTLKLEQFLREENGTLPVVNSIAYKELQSISLSLQILSSSTHTDDQFIQHEGQMEIYGQLQKIIRQTLQVYAKNLKNGAINTYDHIDLCRRSSIKFQMLNSLLFDYFLRDRQRCTNDIENIEVHFYMHLNFDFSTILHQELLLSIMSASDTLSSTMMTIINILKMLEMFQIQKSYDPVINISHVLDSSTKKVLKSIDMPSQSSAPEPPILMLLRLYNIIFQILERLRMLNVEFPTSLKAKLQQTFDNPVQMIETLNNVKLSSRTVTILIRHYQSENKMTSFVTEFIRQRCFSFEENDFNSLLNNIDLSDTFEFNPVVKNLSIRCDLSFNTDKTPKELPLFSKEAQSCCSDSAMRGNLNMDCKELKAIKDELRKKFKNSVTNISKFHSELNDVLASYYEISDKSVFDIRVSDELTDTTYSLLMLILNYTPNYLVFIRKYYTPRLLRRIIYYERDWFKLFNQDNNIDRMLIQMLPQKTKTSLIELIEIGKQKIGLQKSNKFRGIPLNEIYLECSQYDFSLPNSLPIFPDKSFNDAWQGMVKKGKSDTRGTHLTQSLHIVEISSPFKNEQFLPVRIKAPMTLASILLCFQEQDSIAISDIKEKLHVTRSQEPILVNGIKTLIKYELLRKSGPFVKLRMNLIPISSLSDNGEVLFIY